MGAAFLAGGRSGCSKMPYSQRFVKPLLLPSHPSFRSACHVGRELLEELRHVAVLSPSAESNPTYPAVWFNVHRNSASLAIHPAHRRFPRARPAPCAGDRSVPCPAWHGPHVRVYPGEAIGLPHLSGSRTMLPCPFVAVPGSSERVGLGVRRDESTWHGCDFTIPLAGIGC